MPGCEVLEPRCLLTAIIMTAQEQLLLELVNRSRATPAAEAALYEVDLNQDLEPGEISDEPKQPLAPNQQLIQTARGHSQNMLDLDFFEHVNPQGQGPTERGRANGYPNSVGENIAWFGTPGTLERDQEVYRRHEALFLSPPHRKNMLAAGYREIGNGILYGEFDHLNAIMVTENFGNRGGNAFITGVAYTDSRTPDQFYTIGEGLQGITIEAVRNRDGEQFSTVTGPSGGYALQVPAGIYTVRASGSSIPGALMVNDVAVTHLNQKVDFITRQMPVGGIEGRLFEDLDADGQRDANEPVLAGRTLYLDHDEDGRLDDGETRVVSNGSGVFRVSGLRAGSYVVRQVVPEGWQATAPANESFQVTLARGQTQRGLFFGSRRQNVAPVAADDQASTEIEMPVQINVLANDHDPDGLLDAQSVQITFSPRRGSVTVDAQSGTITYSPRDGFVGSDVFRYSVADQEGTQSNQARVDILVQPGAGNAWQNAGNRYDVNQDGFVTPIDALLILNDLNRHGSRRLPRPQNDRMPPPFIDVSGDAFVSPIDALLVLNDLNHRSARAAVAAPALDAGEIASAVAAVPAVVTEPVPAIADRPAEPMPAKAALLPTRPPTATSRRAASQPAAVAGENLSERTAISLEALDSAFGDPLELLPDIWLP